MTYTQVRPPVIKSNVGDLATPICTVITAAGTVVETGTMVRIPNTTIWYYPVTGSNLAAVKTEYAYYITDSNNDVLDEGSFSVEDVSLGLDGAITEKDFVCPSVIGVPPQVAVTKTYTIRFRPAAADGTFVPSVTSLSGSGVPAIAINFANSVNASTNDVAASMSLSGENWEYAWAITNATPADIVKVTISCAHNGKSYVFTRHTEIVRPREFNPQRLSVGSVG
jgi:hypothetical protein